MNTCRDIEPLLLAERDGALNNQQRATLDQHVAACASCQQLRANLAVALAAFKAEAAHVTVPDANEEWRELRTRMREEKAPAQEHRKLSPIAWLTTPLAAAAAIAIVFFVARPTPQPEHAVPAVETARVAPRLESDASITTIAYVDKDSGWLVVWAADDSAPNRG